MGIKWIYTTDRLPRVYDYVLVSIAPANPEYAAHTAEAALNETNQFVQSDDRDGLDPMPPWVGKADYPADADIVYAWADMPEPAELTFKARE